MMVVLVGEAQSMGGEEECPEKLNLWEGVKRNVRRNSIYGGGEEECPSRLPRGLCLL